MLKSRFKTTPLVASSDEIPLEVREVTPPAKHRKYRVLWAVFKVWFRTRSKKVDEKTKGQAWRGLLEELGGMWVKLGQLMASRTDLFDQEFIDELTKLQCRVYAFPTSKAREIIEESLGRNLDAVLTYFESVPIAAASMAQVHRARLAVNGQQVVVKVQRPYAEEYLKSDMAIMESIVGFLKRFRSLQYLQWDAMKWELDAILMEEIDFRYELTNLKDAKRLLKEHKIYVPKVYKKHSYKKVIVMEYIQGVTMSKYIEVYKEHPDWVKWWLKKNKIKPKKVATKLLHSVWNQLFVQNYFHGDLQPGNIMLLKRNRLALIDFGSVGSTDYRILSIYRQIMISLVTKNFSKAAELVMLLVDDLPASKYNEIKDSLIRGGRESMLKAGLTKVPAEEKTTIHHLNQDLTKELKQFQIPINWGLLKLAKTLSSVVPTVVYLNPKIDVSKKFLKYYKEEYVESLETKRYESMKNADEIINNASEILLRIKRRRAIDQKPMVSAKIKFLAGVLTPIKWLLRIGFYFLLWTYLVQNFEFLDGLQSNDNFWTRAAGQMPQFGHVIWLLTLYFYRSLIKGFIKVLEEMQVPVKEA